MQSEKAGVYLIYSVWWEFKFRRFSTDCRHLSAKQIPGEHVTLEPTKANYHGILFTDHDETGFGNSAIRAYLLQRLKHSSLVKSKKHQHNLSNDAIDVSNDCVVQILSSCVSGNWCRQTLHRRKKSTSL